MVLYHLLCTQCHLGYPRVQTFLAPLVFILYTHPAQQINFYLIRMLGIICMPDDTQNITLPLSLSKMQPQLFQSFSLAIESVPVMDGF